jgi:ABC-type multidrug transport system fused ATPase/permease subunit
MHLSPLTIRTLESDEGRIVEEGKHEDLIRGSGRYALLHRVQTGEAIDAA